MNWILRIQDKRSFAGGVVLLAYSIGLVLYALAHYKLGTLSQMGPGMFPIIVGTILILLSILVIVPALRTPGDPFQIHWRPLFAVLGTIVAFAVMIRPFGLVPAIFVMTFIAGFAGDRLGLRNTVFLAAVIAVLTVGIFHYALRLRFEIFAWPF